MVLKIKRFLYIICNICLSLCSRRSCCHWEQDPSGNTAVERRQALSRTASEDRTAPQRTSTPRVVASKTAVGVVTAALGDAPPPGPPTSPKLATRSPSHPQHVPRTPSRFKPVSLNIPDLYATEQALEELVVGGDLHYQPSRWWPQCVLNSDG